MLEAEVFLILEFLTFLTFPFQFMSAPDPNPEPECFPQYCARLT